MVHKNALAYLGYALPGTSGSRSVKFFPPTALMLEALPPHAFYREPLFICIDVAKHCTNRELSEIGLSFFNTQDISTPLVIVDSSGFDLSVVFTTGSRSTCMPDKPAQSLAAGIREMLGFCGI